MTGISYKLLLNNKLIGISKLEFGDPPMGVVFGKIEFLENNTGYNFIKQYCIDNNIEILTDFANEKLISTGIIEQLKVYNYKNIELVGLGNSIEGMDSEGYNVTILGLDSAVYNLEFKEHILKYEQLLKF